MNIWEKYKESRRITIQLSELDPVLKGLYVIVLPTSAYEPAVSEQISQAGASLPEDQKTREQNRFAMQKWIQEWNLPLNETGALMPLPSQDLKENKWEQVLPLEVQVFIMKKIMEVDEQRLEVPTQNARPS